MALNKRHATKRRRKKPYSKDGVHKHRKAQRKTMLAYVSKYTKSAIEKLKYLERTNAYKGSEKAQYAKGQLRNLYRKFDYNADIYHTGKGFIAKLTSNADLTVLYNAIQDIRSIDTREAKMNYMAKKVEYEDLGVNYDEKFNLMSRMSVEFHEIFAFISYGESEVEFKEGNITTPDEMLGKFLDTIEDKELDETKIHYAESLVEKIDKRYNSVELSYLLDVGNRSEIYEKFKK